MKRAICTLLLAALLGSASGALAADGPMLTAEDLAKLQPAYEAFLDELEDLIVEKGLLADDQREAWRMYQLGDFFQNGGYGMIAAMYTPDLLVYARDVDSLVSLSCQTGAGLLELQTMRGYTPLDSALPGLLLEVSLSDAEGMPVPCRFRFTATQGSFLAWDALGARYAEVGISLINDGRPVYWSNPPLTSDELAQPPVITLEILGDSDDEALACATLTLTPSGTGWRVEDGALK